MGEFNDRRGTRWALGRCSLGTDGPDGLDRRDGSGGLDGLDGPPGLHGQHVQVGWDKSARLDGSGRDGLRPGVWESEKEERVRRTRRSENIVAWLIYYGY